VVLTIDGAHSLETLVKMIRERHPTLSVVVRARDADHASQLYNHGVSEAVPETVESSLQLAEAVLVDLDVPMGKVIASIHAKRAELREQIQSGTSGLIRPTVRSRAKAEIADASE
jgi:CPA2 family monovalent cation:H+ antiporter-2